MTTNLEILKSKDLALENEVNQALKDFSAEAMQLQNEIIKNKDLKVWTKEEMEAYLTSWELLKRIEWYIQINGDKISISKLEMDATSGLLKMKYKVKFWAVEKELISYFQVVGETNNSYLQFKTNPVTNVDFSSLEVYEKDGTTIVAPEDGYRNGKMYDINIVKTASKGIDIRILENEKKTKEKVIENIKKYELTGDFKPEDFVDITLENTKIETLQYTQLGKEVIAEWTGYYRAIFMREGEKYREIGKVYFDEKGKIDIIKTQKSQEFKLLNIAMKITVDTDKNTFKIENIDLLKKQIIAQREVLKTYISNSEFGDNTIFEGFNRAKGGEWKQTKLLWLKLIDDMYTFKRWGDKKEEKLNFWFSTSNELSLKDEAGKDKDPVTIEIEKANGKKELKDIKKDVTKKNLTIDKPSNELTKNQDKPTLEDEPDLLKKDYLYNQNGTKLEYHNKKGTLLTSIPASKTDTNEWKLDTLSEDVKLDDLFKYLKKNTIDKDIWTRIKATNLLENDISTAFSNVRTKRNKVNISWREVVRVVDNEKDGIYTYYKVDQKKDGDPFAFEKDEELYTEAQTVMDGILENFVTIEKIENTKLSYKDKKEKIEKPFTQFVGWCALLPLTTISKTAFLEDTDTKKAPLTKTFIRGLKTDNIQTFAIQLNIKNTKITANEKKQTINTIEYKTRLEEKDGALTLWFDDIE